MADQSLPPEVLDLIARQVESMEQLETLLLLHGEPGRSFTAAEIAERLKLEPTASARTAELLEGRRLLERGETAGSWRYAATTPHHAAVESLAHAYRTRPVTLIKAVYERPAGALRSFAEAFRIRSDRDDRTGQGD